MRSLWSLLLFTALVSLPVQPQEAYAQNDSHKAENAFDAKAEFPNHFAKIKREQLEEALASVFERLVIPVVPEGAKQAKLVRYFEYVREQTAGQIGKNTRIMPSGGVVRSALSYLYDEIQAGLEKEHPVSPEETLRAIIEAKDNLSGLKVRGVGGDWDLLIDGASYEEFKALSSLLLKITNSAETQYRFREKRGGFKRALFTVGDVKDYNEQISRSTKQGGSTIDFLSFDLENKRLIEPAAFPTIVADFLNGLFEYAPPASKQNVEDADKQTVRGLRPLLELPFLALKNDKQLRHELEEMLKKLRASNASLSGKALEQFSKMVRNARYSGAHNRFYRAKKDSLDVVVFEILELLRKRGGKPMIPEFVDRFSLKKRPKLPAKFPLMDVEAFFEKHTDGGFFYHGTPSPENGLAILRGGLIVSTSKQGVAIYGRGAYGSRHLDTALSYAHADGIVFRLRVKRDKSLRVLDWGKHQDDPALAAIAAKAKEDGKDVFEVLARDYGIDIILNGHLLLQNLEAVEFPEGLGELVRAYGSSAKNPKAKIEQRFESLSDYERLYDYAVALAEKDLPPPAELRQSILERAIEEIRKSSGKKRIERIIMLIEKGGAENTPAKFAQELADAVAKIAKKGSSKKTQKNADEDTTHADQALEALAKLSLSNPEYRSPVMKAVFSGHFGDYESSNVLSELFDTVEAPDDALTKEFIDTLLELKKNEMPEIPNGAMERIHELYLKGYKKKAGRVMKRVLKLEDRFDSQTLQFAEALYLNETSAEAKRLALDHIDAALGSGFQRQRSTDSAIWAIESLIEAEPDFLKKNPGIVKSLERLSVHPAALKILEKHVGMTEAAVKGLLRAEAPNFNFLKKHSPEKALKKVAEILEKVSLLNVKNIESVLVVHSYGSHTFEGGLGESLFLGQQMKTPEFADLLFETVAKKDNSLRSRIAKIVPRFSPRPASGARWLEKQIEESERLGESDYSMLGEIAAMALVEMEVNSPSALRVIKKKLAEDHPKNAWDKADRLEAIADRTTDAKLAHALNEALELGPSDAKNLLHTAPAWVERESKRARVARKLVLTRYADPAYAKECIEALELTRYGSLEEAHFSLLADLKTLPKDIETYLRETLLPKAHAFGYFEVVKGVGAAAVLYRHGARDAEIKKALKAALNSDASMIVNAAHSAVKKCSIKDSEDLLTNPDAFF